VGGKGIPDEITVNNQGTTVMRVEGLDDMDITLHTPDTMKTDMTTKATMGLTVNPLSMNTTGRQELAITEPIVTNMSTDMRLDVKPMVVDACITLKIADLPEQRIRRPYDRRIKLSVFGTELVELRMCGESEIVVEDLPVKPTMAWGAQKSNPHRSRIEPVDVQDDSSPGVRINLGD
jgi:hypothetical protein